MKRTVFVIGGSGGIGYAVCKLFAESGFNVVATYNRRKIKEGEFEFKQYQLDVTKSGDVEKVFKQALGSVDYIHCVVNCSGISCREALLMDESIQNIDRLIDVNLKGAIYVSREAMKYLSRQRSGSIINISSVYGEYGGACESTYSASKGGLIALTKALAAECANFNVRVNAISPGAIDTDMLNYFSAEEKKEIANSIPLKRLGRPIDVANAVKFLASDDGGYITGAILSVAGGAIKF